MPLFLFLLFLCAVLALAFRGAEQTVMLLSNKHFPAVLAHVEWVIRIREHETEYQRNCQHQGMEMPRITMIFYDRPVDEQLLPGWKPVPLEYFDTIEDLVVKFWSSGDESLFMSVDFDAFLRFSPAEREKMADRLEDLISAM